LDEITIRRAVADDAVHLSELAGQLGYRRTPHQIEAWIERSGGSTVALVADVGGVVVGWLEAHEVDLLQSPRSVEIGGLVVAEGIRDRGVGRQLVDAASLWAKEHGHDLLEVRSNIVRDGAHGFYEGLGFKRVKTSYTFSIGVI
jgi:ribosomal protein S18 acetylase RimI-like enzyme